MICENCQEIAFSKNCAKCTKFPQKWGPRNDCHPTDLPDVFIGLTQQATSCIRMVIKILKNMVFDNCFFLKINPIKPIVDKRDGFKGRMMNFINELQSVTKILPDPSPIIVFDKISPSEKEKTIIVEQKRVHEALVSLKQNNEFYKDIDLNQELQLDEASKDDIEFLQNLENLYNTCNYSFNKILFNFIKLSREA